MLLSGLILGLFSLSEFELKRKAQIGVREAMKVFPLKAHGSELLITLVLTDALVVVGLIVILGSVLNSVGTVVVGSVLIAVFGILLPPLYIKNRSVWLTAKLSWPIKKLLVVFHPLSLRLARLLDKAGSKDEPVIYSRQKLLKLFEEHKASPYSDIEADEARIVKHALTFGDKLVRDVMVPRRVVKMLANVDTIGPVLMNELHANGHSRFPVYSGKQDNIVGTLYMRDLVSAKEGGKVKDVMSKDVYYVHDEQPLGHALQAFLKTKHHLFIVINSFEEYVGIITIEDVLEQILGKPIMDEFDQYEDLRAVAALKAKEEHKKHAAP